MDVLQITCSDLFGVLSQPTTTSFDKFEVFNSDMGPGSGPWMEPPVALNLKPMLHRSAYKQDGQPTGSGGTRDHLEANRFLSLLWSL